MYMNIQAMMKQAQALQKDMLKAKDEIDNSLYVGENAMIKITMKGSKEVSEVELKIDESLDKDDLEMLQDMIKSAYNDATKKIDADTEKKMGKFGNIPGLF
ncbi:MAG: YbaB/EbfC family nucleoid-associated protein [Bacilli bacterium]|nr:YbaB/EbfC family nucleoid-associated protein [Bacilli bacterium]